MYLKCNELNVGTNQTNKILEKWLVKFEAVYLVVCRNRK